MDEKCVCHINGYRLKDTEARKTAEAAVKEAEDAKKAATDAENSIAATATVANQAKSAADGANVTARAAAQIAKSAESKADEAKTAAAAAPRAEKTAAEAKTAAAAALPRTGGIMTGNLDMGGNTVENVRQVNANEAVGLKEYSGFDISLSAISEPGVLRAWCKKNMVTGVNKDGSVILRGVAPGVNDTDAVNMAQVLEMVRNGNGSDSGQNVVDVTHYGAMGDGQTDDTEAIATAMAAVPTGGTLYFPAGTYMVDNVFAKSDMTIRGDGWGSVIKLLPARTNYHGRNSCINIENVERVIVRDIKLDGDRATQQATAASQDQRLNGLFITSAKDVYIENVWMYNNGYHGCIMVEVENVTFSHCRSSLNGFRPIHGHTEIYNVRVSNCICEDNGKGLTGGSGFENDAVFFFGVQRLTINDNIVRSNRRGCICVGSDHSSVTTGTVIPSGSISITGNVCECYEDLPYVPTAESDTGVAKFSSQGIVVYGSDGEMRNVTVSGNTIKNAHEAIYLYASDNLVTSLNAAVTGNTIIDCSIGVKAVEVADITITGNQFRNLAEQMMYVQSVERLLVSGNNVCAPAISEYRLCRVHRSSDVVFTGNQFICPARIAVYAPDSNTNVVVMNNVMLGFADENPITNTNGVTQNNIIGQTAVEPEPDDGGDAGDGDYPDDGGDAGDGDYPDDSDVETEKVYAGAYENAGFVRLNLASPNTGSVAYVHTTPIPMTDADIRYELNTYVAINDEPEDYTGVGADKEPSIVFLSGDDHMTDAVGIVPMFTRTNGTWSYNANNFITNATNRIFGFTISISAKKVRELFPTATHVMFQVEKSSDPDAVSSMTFGPLGDGKSYVYRAV